jgi:hypothetical protein
MCFLLFFVIFIGFIRKQNMNPILDLVIPAKVNNIGLTALLIIRYLLTQPHFFLSVQEEQTHNLKIYTEVTTWEHHHWLLLSHIFWLTRLLCYCTNQQQIVRFWETDFLFLLDSTKTRLELMTYLQSDLWSRCLPEGHKLLILSTIIYYHRFHTRIGDDAGILVLNAFFSLEYKMQLVITKIKSYRTRQKMLRAYVITHLLNKIYKKRKLRLLVCIWQQYVKKRKYIKQKTVHRLSLFYHCFKATQVKNEIELRQECIYDLWNDRYYQYRKNRLLRIEKRTFEKWKMFVKKEKQEKRTRFLAQYVLQTWKANVLVPTRVYNLKLERRLLYFLVKVLTLCLQQLCLLILTKEYKAESRQFLIDISNLTCLHVDHKWKNANEELDLLKRQCTIVSNSSFYKIHKNYLKKETLSHFRCVNRLLNDLKASCERMIKGIHLIPTYVHEHQMETFMGSILNDVHEVNTYPTLKWWRNHKAPKYITFTMDEIGLQITRAWLDNKSTKRTDLILELEAKVPTQCVSLATEQPYVNLFQADLTFVQTTEPRVVFCATKLRLSIVVGEQLKGENKIQKLSDLDVINFLKSKRQKTRYGEEPELTQDDTKHSCDSFITINQKKESETTNTEMTEMNEITKKKKPKKKKKKKSQVIVYVPEADRDQFMNRIQSLFEKKQVFVEIL